MAKAENVAEEKVTRRDGLALRALSAVILIPIVLGAVYLGGRVFAAVVAFATIVMVFEWTRMVERREFSGAFYLLAGGAALALFAASSGVFSAAYGICLASGVGAYLIARRDGPGAAWPAFASIYIIAPAVALLWLRLDVENGRALTFLLYAVVWAGDTGAYVFGKLVGGPKFSPSLSPAKTWAGIIGGVLAGGVAGYWAAASFFGGAVMPTLLVGACLGGASVIGDLAESAFKRQFGVKDISGFIPGHGGALDRMDGMIFATTAMTSALFIYMVVEKFQGSGQG